MIKILAIDDTNDNLISLKALITDSFPDSFLITSLNGKKGIELALENDPDVVLLDIVMPIMDGFEVCRQFKKNKQLRDIPIVFLSSFKDKVNHIKALEIGAQGFLTKPIDKTELIAQIKAMVKIRSVNRLQLKEKEKLSKLVASRTHELELSQITKNQLRDDLNIENITRKKTEELLNKTEESYQNLFEANPHPLWVYQRETLLFLAVNATAINHYGFSNQEFLSMTIVDLHPQEDIPTFINQLQNVEVSLHEIGVWRHYKKNGQIIWVEITAHPINWCGQQAVVVLAHDITERKLAEEDLKTALQQLEFHENNSPMAVIEFNNKFQIRRWSENARSIFGWNTEEILGKTIDEIRWVHEEDVQKVEDLIADMIASQRTSNCHTNRNYRKDGSVITCEWYNSALVDSNGKLISVHSLVMDITERENAEKSLLESNTFNQSLLQAIPFGMHIVDETGDILFANEIMEQHIGTVAIGKKCWELYRDNKTRCLNCPLPAGITIGKTSISESYNIFGGRVSQISHSGMSFKGHKAMLEIFQDITERKHIETE
ncbi:MAG TPA: PAS domain S-box protein, partial [Prolixibacteraceae bacterium]|nr:PAS domain S-box protein [Prolixibacteraceae bacterium]